MGMWSLDAHCPLPALSFEVYLKQRGRSLVPVQRVEGGTAALSSSPASHSGVRPPPAAAFYRGVLNGLCHLLKQNPCCVLPWEEEGERTAWS